MVQKMHRVSLIYLMKGVFKMNKNEHTATMYESIPAVAELNKVPGFNPLKLLRRIILQQHGRHAPLAPCNRCRCFFLKCDDDLG